MPLVNLDALIRREDFTTMSPASQGAVTPTLRIADLERTSVVYNLLRMPAFQRETANWDPNRIAEFIQSFVERDLISSIIL